jgi:hypothetical protein
VSSLIIPESGYHAIIQPQLEEFIMEYRGLRIAKDILFKTFLIGYLVIIASWVLFTLSRGYWEDMILRIWHLQNPAYIELITISFFAMAKFVLIFYALVPALAICWTLRKLEKKSL